MAEGCGGVKLHSSQKLGLEGPALGPGDGAQYPRSHFCDPPVYSKEHALLI